MSSGFVYILINPAMPDWVKIGSTHDIKERLSTLNSETGVPLRFRAYALLEVNDYKKIENNIQDLIDIIDGSLRSKEEKTQKQKERTREFYKMSPEKAFTILKKIAVMLGIPDKLQLVKPTEEEQKEADEENIKRRAKMTFAELKIPVGSELSYIYDESIKCTVLNEERAVSYNGEKTSVSKLAQALLNYKQPPQGTSFWKYNGETLLERRLRLEQES